MNITKQYKINEWKVILAFVLIYFGWGSTYMAIMVALKSFPPFILAAIRFITAGLVLLFWSKLNGEKIPSTRDIVQLSFVGILLLFFGSGSVIWVEQYLTSSLASIIWASLPIWFIILDKRNWSINFSNIKLVIGLLLGFFGVLFLLGDKELISFNGGLMLKISFFIAIGGTVIFALGSLYMKYRPVMGSTNSQVSIQLLAAGLLSLMVGFVAGEHQKVVLNNISLESSFALIYLIVIGSLGAYLAYVWLISVMSPALVGTYTYVNPAVAVFLGWSMLGETISMQKLIALSIILTGVLIVNIYKSKNGNHIVKRRKNMII